MDVRVNLSTFIIFIGLVIVDCRRCTTSSPDTSYGKCPDSKPKCCGTKRNGRQNMCATSCVHFKCETNFHCDGLTCCSGYCSENKNCLPVTTWGVVGIAIVCLFILLVLFRTCQWCRKRAKVCTRRDSRTTSEEQGDNNEPPFVVSDFENHGFITPMAPPAYESVVQNTGSRTDGYPPVYNLNLQTIINNSSRNDPGSNNLEVNISIRGSAMFNDFPPSYSEISNPRDDDDGQGGVANFGERTLALSYSDEPPPYSLSEESTEESPENTTREEASNTTTDLSIDEDSTLSHDDTSLRELQTVNSSIPEADNQQLSNHSSNVNETTLTNSESRDEILNDEQPSYDVNEDEDTSSSDLSNNSSQSDGTVSETATTYF